MAERVVVNDVGPRDGLQNQPISLSVEARLKLIEAIQVSGLSHIELGAFVSPKAVPQMAGSDKVAAGLQQRKESVYSALVPNLKGYELALAEGIQTVAMVLYGSDAMAEKNVSMTRGSAEQATLAMLERAKSDGVSVIATIAVAFVCPFSGATDPEAVYSTTDRILDAGASRVVVADTIGAATPDMVSDLTEQLSARFGAENLGCHFHDTRALGMANTYAALQAGVRYFDASIAGLGGCPFAPGASGNVATEDLVMLLHSMGYETGIDLNKLLLASDFAGTLVSAPGGRSKLWLKRFLEAGRSLQS